MKYLVPVALAFSAGCILPVSTGAPLPATTVGKGNVGFAVHGEAPTLDLIADQDNKSSGTPDAIAYGAAPAATATLSFSYGLADDTDLEVAGEGALYYFILPIPTGGTIGLRQHVPIGDTFDLAFAVKAGHVGATANTTDSNGNKSSSGANANYGDLQAVVQVKHGLVRPALAVSFMPSHIKRHTSDNMDFSFNGFATSVTGSLQFVGRNAVFGPYLAATNFYSDRFNNSGWFVSGGLLFALRPDRNRPRVVIPDAPPINSPPPSPPPSAPPPPPTAAPM